MFERYTEAARRSLFFARYEASQLGSRAIETEHILLGLMRDRSGLASRLLASSHVTSESVRRVVEERSAAREKISTSVEIPFSAETKRVLQHALAEADGLGHNYVDTEHLLLGLLHEERTVAGSILASRGLHLDRVRSTLVQLVKEEPGTSLRADFIEQVERIKQLTSQLGQTLPGTVEARMIVERIIHELETLKRSLPE
jgi:ATP-dependent Clp protease ATP-binding subunit ClpC